jgi:hypothetical protein
MNDSLPFVTGDAFDEQMEGFRALHFLKAQAYDLPLCSLERNYALFIMTLKGDRLTV